MLRFDLAEVIRTPGMRQDYRIDEPPYKGEDVEFVEPVTGKISVTNTGSMLLVRGPIRSAILLECSRCLEPVRIPISVTLEEDFDLRVVEDQVHHDKSVQVVEDEVGQVFDGKVLQLDVLIRQATLLAAPLQPLCSEDCPGIAIQENTDSEQETPTFGNAPFRDLRQYFQD